MAAGDFLLDATGRRVLDSTGRQQLSNGVDDTCVSDPCDCPSGTACARCIVTLADCTPTTIQATVSGISTCTGCHEYRNPGATGSYLKLTGDPNGVWCMTQSGSCSWVLNTSDVLISEYSNSSCTTLVGVSSMRLLYQRLLSGATEILRFQMIAGNTVSGAPSIAAVMYAHDETVSVGPTPGCIVTSSTSIITSGSCGQLLGSLGARLGLGGSATFDACC
jgi:hypothetical protein